jgi:hypothetical protein
VDETRALAERSAAALAARPVWLFSSGPVGEPAKPAGNPVDITKILQATSARDHPVSGLVSRCLTSERRSVNFQPSGVRW